MPSPQVVRRSLVGEVAAVLRVGMTSGRWGGWLPGERALAAELGVSRGTLRWALEALRVEGVVEPVRGEGWRARGKRTRASSSSRPRAVRLILPAGIQDLRPTLALWIEALHGMLTPAGVKMTVHEGRQWYGAGAAGALDRLLAAHPGSCWLPVMSTPTMQRWFAARGVPCLVAGTCHQGVSLPSVDLDHEGIGRHAAGMFLAHGHRRIAVVASDERRAGDAALCAAFVDAVARSAHEGASAQVIEHVCDPRALGRTLRRVMRSAAAPTGLFVLSSLFYATVHSCLLHEGGVVPGKASLICRDDDDFLRYLAPEPARYLSSPKVYAKRVMQRLHGLLERGGLPARRTLVLPEFYPGETLGRLE